MGGKVIDPRIDEEDLFPGATHRTLVRLGYIHQDEISEKLEMGDQSQKLLLVVRCS